MTQDATEPNIITPGYVRIAKEVMLEFLRTGYLGKQYMVQITSREREAQR